MNINDVYKILDIRYDDTKADVLNKFGLFRLRWLQDKKEYSIKEMDKIGEILTEMISNRFDK